MNSPRRPEADLRDLVSESHAALVAAETDGPDAATVDALRRCVRQLEGSIDTDGQHPNGYDGFIDYTIDDEDFESYFRQFDVRVYYSWEDYDQADEPFVSWGANVERCEVLAVHYFDEVGNELSAPDYHLDEALRLVEERQQLVTEACTADGYRNGVGQCHPLYTAPTNAPLSEDRAAPRMAPSSRTRQSQQDHRNYG